MERINSKADVLRFTFCSSLFLLDAVPNGIYWTGRIHHQFWVGIVFDSYYLLPRSTVRVRHTEAYCSGVENFLRLAFAECALDTVNFEIMDSPEARSEQETGNGGGEQENRGKSRTVEIIIIC